jgi:GTP-binding protein Era
MPHRAGYAAIVGRPNVGKSTLLNALVGTKVAIVTPKPQTTRNRIVGIKTLPEAQIAFVDTPGIHAARSTLNRRMVDVARRTLGEVDAVLLVIDASVGLRPEDRALVESLPPRMTTIVVLNKIDRIAKPSLLPLMATVGELLPGREVVPVSARKGSGVPVLLDVVARAMPEGPRLHPEDEFTTEPARFLAQEAVREYVFRALAEEIPYGTAVVVEDYAEKPDQNLVVIHATILVERENHKGIVVGAGGTRLREIGRQARVDLEALLGTRVFLELFVRAEPGWAEDPHRLAELGL